MPKMLAIGLGTACIVAAVLLVGSDDRPVGNVGLTGGTARDPTFVKTPTDDRPAGRR